MVKEKYVIEVGTRSIKYLSESVKGYKLTDNLDFALFVDSEESVNTYLKVPVLKDKNYRIRKVKITYELL